MKILLLSLAMLTTTANVFAQLYVTPNGATDSYIYVDDEVLFVEQDINLAANNSGTTEASIYLRNQAQLVQGTTVIPNSGTGYISVFQDSNSDSYDYNFWGSPVGNMSGSGNNNFGMARVNDSLSLTNSTVALTTPGYNGASVPLTISTRWYYRWNPATQRYVYNGMGNVVPPGYGFIMKGTDVTVHIDPFNDPQNQLYDFRGRPNSGDITIQLQTGVTSSDGVMNDYTLAGNPYPSALDLNEVFYDANRVTPKFSEYRFWDEDRSINSHYYIDNKGGFGTWIPLVEDDTNPGFYTRPTFYNYNAGGGQGGSTGIMGPIIERRFAPIGQGFMIKALVTGSITIKNSHREYIVEGVANDSQFRSPIPINNDPITTAGGSTGGNDNFSVIPQIRIITVFGENSHMRDMGLLFYPSSTDGFDLGMDATHPMDAAVAETYFKIGDSPDTYMNLVIQTVPFEPYKQVPIAFTLEEEMKFVVKVVEQINTPFDKAYLYDSSNGSYQEITAGEDAVLFLPTGIYEDRFFITFRGDYQDRNSNPLTTAQNELSENVNFFQNNPISQLEISNPEGYNIRSVSIFDMGGKLILTQENLGTQSRLSFPTANFSDGIYLVKLSTVDNLTLDYKISVFNK
jgi:Secretion system C-terminal sorting domain